MTAGGRGYQARYCDELIEHADPGRAEMIERLRGRQPLANVLPLYDQTCTASKDGLWVRRYRRPGEARPNDWPKVNEQGEIQGRLITPSGFEALECGEGYVLGLQPDKLDVEHLLSYNLKVQ